jgi:thiol-disulfide isomerase/thioredoxin
MNRVGRTVLLILALLLIIGAIWFLEGQKVGTISSGDHTIDLSLGTTSVHTADFASRAKQFSAAKELVAPDGYINADTSLTIQSLIGKKIVLVDFWTYSCINCLRTIPYLNAWYAKYKDLGLQIIGVHSPEFEFEKSIDNVKMAVRNLGIQYPVVLDSEHQTWSAYNNLYWPEHYLIDINGLVVDRHIGEGNYVDTEHKIQELLRERAQALGLSVVIPEGTVNVNETIETNSPETYFGSTRNEYLANGSQGQNGVQSFIRPQNISLNQLNLVGLWNIEDEYAKNTSAEAHIIYRYSATNVYFVASSKNGVRITVLRDGVPVKAQKGADVDESGHVLIKEARLYKLVQEPTMGEHTLEIIIDTPGLDAYTFTFG